MLSEVTGSTEDVFAHQERRIWEDTKETSSRWDPLCKLLRP